MIFRRRDVPVQVFQWDAENYRSAIMPPWLKEARAARRVEVRGDTVIVREPGGVRVLESGDWLIHEGGTVLGCPAGEFDTQIKVG